MMDVLFRRLFALETRAFRVDSSLGKDATRLLAVEQGLRESEQQRAAYGSVFGSTFGSQGNDVILTVVLKGCNGNRVGGIYCEVWYGAAVVASGTTDASGTVKFGLDMSSYTIRAYPAAITGYSNLVQGITITGATTVTLNLLITTGRICTTTCDRLLTSSGFTLTTYMGTVSLLNNLGVLTATQTVPRTALKGFYRDDGSGNPVPGECWQNGTTVTSFDVFQRVQISGTLPSGDPNTNTVNFETGFYYAVDITHPVGFPVNNAGTNPAASGYTLAGFIYIGGGNLGDPDWNANPAACAPFSASYSIPTTNHYGDAIYTTGRTLTINEV